MMTDGSVMCIHILSFWKFPDKGFQVHGCALVLQPSGHRISLHTESRGERKL